MIAWPAFRVIGRVRVTILVAACLTLLIASGSSAEEPPPLARLEAMGLETMTEGRITAYFAADDRERAVELATILEEAAAMLEGELGLAFTFRLAVLAPERWFTTFPDGPYTIPWCSIDERVIFVPSSAERMPPGTFRRAIDFIALHELGHLANKQYFHPSSAYQYGPVNWTEELLATYFGYAYVATVDPRWAESSAQEWRDAVNTFTPSVRSLDWSFMRDLPPDELGVTYAWYQQMLNLRAAEVFSEHGVSFLSAAKAGLPWAHLETWTTDSVLSQLEQIAPGFETWARALESEASLPD